MPRGIGWIYQAALALALLLAGPFLLLFRARHYLPTLAGRMAWGGEPAPGRPLWIHAVSVGEAAVAATLAPRLPESVPLLVTTITPTGQARARAGFARFGDRARIAYLPFDPTAESLFVLVGWDYALHKNLSFIPNVEWIGYDAVDGGEDPDDDLVARLTASWKF